MSEPDAPTAQCFNPRPSSLTGEPAGTNRTFTETILFQSAPVIADGRALSSYAPTMSPLLFQSAPVIADGRAHGLENLSSQVQEFQSAPVIADGRAPPLFDALLPDLAVSIRARHR